MASLLFQVRFTGSSHPSTAWTFSDNPHLLKNCTSTHASSPFESYPKGSGRRQKDKHRNELTVRGLSVEEENVVDQDFMDELNKVSNRTLEVLSSCQEAEARRLSKELKDMQQYLEEVNDVQSIQFLSVLQGFLNHKVLKEVDSLSGMYSRAADRILNQVSGSDWQLHEEGQPKDQQEPSFSTWDDVINKKKQGTPQTGSVKNSTFYRLLQVGTSASAAEIKQSFRRLALKLHPDVNHEADAAERFSEVSNAYDVLSDPRSRELYDLHGTDASSHQEASAGRGNARDAWDEFKPFKKENKRTRARDAVRTQSSAAAQSSTSTAEANASNDSLPQVGDIVEYPLRSVETEDFNDGRTHGVGLLVGRNMDRGDAAKLPKDQLDICEVESLRQEEPESLRWIADDLGIPSFARLNELKIVPVEDFNKRFGIWTIKATLSTGCGGPPLPEEVIL